MSEVVDFLATVPLFDGVAEAELADLAELLQRRDVPVGEVLWSQGDEPLGMLLIVDGRVSVSLRLPGEREVEVASMGHGEVLGEIPLVDGGQHSATARVSEPASLLSLSRAD